MSSNFPTSLDSLATTKANATVTSTDHPAHHNDMADAVNKIEAKLGISSSTPVANSVLAGTGTGTSAWTTTPTIGATSWANANHAHAAANSGGQIGAANLSGATLASGVVTSSLTSVGTLTGLNLASGAAVNWNSGDVTLTHSANTLAFAGASSGYTFDTGLTINAGNPLTLNTAAVGTKYIAFQVATALRWNMGTNATAESGSNAGSDFQIHRYSDAGAFLGTAVTITRSSGAATFAGALTVNTGGIILGANNLTTTGTISATGARVTQSYHTNITSTNAVTVDSSLLSKVPESIYDYTEDALAILRKVRVVGYRHHRYLDASNRVKLGVIAETVGEPLVLQEIETPVGDTYPGINLMGLLALQTRALQQADARIATLEARLN